MIFKMRLPPEVKAPAPKREISVKFTTPHAGQRALIVGAQRFNVISCGRRFGKTEYGLERVGIPAIERAAPTAWFAPSFRMLKEAWERFETTLAPVIFNANRSERSMKLITGGHIDFYSLANAHTARGRKYLRVVIDEAAHAPGLKNAWQQVIRPTLTDLKGGADFLSSPNGRNNDFFEFFSRPGTPQGVGWAAFSMPTLSNPYIDPSEIEAARLELDPLTFAQEYLAEFVDFVAKPFAYAFDAAKHTAPMQYFPGYPLTLSFDFGVDPMPCVALQFHKFPREVRVLKEFYMYDGDVRSLLQEVKVWLATLDTPPHILITGDPSGRARSPLAEGAGTAFRIIMDELKLPESRLRVPARFSIHNSRTLLNSVLAHVPVKIDSRHCKNLINDLKYVEVERGIGGEIKLKKTGTNAAARQKNEFLTHFLDAFRYSLHTEFTDIAHKIGAAPPPNADELEKQAADFFKPNPKKR